MQTKCIIKTENYQHFFRFSLSFQITPITKINNHEIETVWKQLSKQGCCLYELQVSSSEERDHVLVRSSIKQLFTVAIIYDQIIRTTFLKTIHDMFTFISDYTNTHILWLFIKLHELCY